jgi:predicted nuclease of predicted toxin-antitoxin system
MRVLVDECLPRQLKGWIAHFCEASTVQEMGWANIKNGKLLRAANEAKFDAFLTADKNMYFQQNFDGLNLSSVVIPTNRKRLVQKCVSALQQSLQNIQQGQKVVMDLGLDVDAWESMRLHTIERDDQHTTHKFKTPDFGR